MRKLLVFTLVGAIALILASPVAAAPWVKKAAVDGRYAGKWVETECT